MAATAVELNSGGLRLEGLLYGCGRETQPIVVVCHPHPLRGGDMHNNVVTTVALTLESMGVAALCFNFRGVGRSEGAHDGGAGEQGDVRAALEYARSLSDAGRVGLAGYSFGAGMAAAVVDGEVAALCLVSPPERSFAAATALWAYDGPVLLIAGDADHAVTPGALRRTAGALPQAQAVVVVGADHFWWGYEDRLEAAVREFFERLA